MIKRIFVLTTLILVVATQAQEVLVPLGGNSILMQAHKEQKAALTQKPFTTAAFLPFADDFSYFGPYPDPARWVNSTSVFVNHTKATQPITIGAATFDGMMANGYPYHNNFTTGSYASDTLTSIPLRLDSMNGVSLIPSDSVTLRFYYQARGIIERPDNNEDLYLDFYNPTSGSWAQKWFKTAYNPGTDSSFKHVMIAITDTAYLKNGFQFRFRNYSTGCGDVDHWHVDGIYVDKKLNPNRDTIVQEISFAFDQRSILKNYSQMPFNQFLGAADMLANMNASRNLRNNYSTGVNLTTYYQINNGVGLNVAQNTNGTNNVLPFGSGGYCSDQALINPSLNGFTYGSGPFADSTSFLLKFYATNLSDNYHENDTIYYRQKFHNYFAYDDGSAETGYGFLNSPNSTTAVRYKLNVPDTLRAIDIFFDPIINVNQLQNSGIRLIVYADNAGLPGQALFIDSLSYPFPIYSTNGHDVFQRYQLSTPVTFTAATTFYIALWQQVNLNYNVGYDLNTNSRTEVLYNTGSGWNVSGFKGSLMMHPVFGDSSRAIGVQTQTAKKNEKVLLYPNPATNEVIVSAESGIQKIMLCDLLGNTVLESIINKLDVSSVPNGMYLVKTLTNKGLANTQKLIIAR